jgi:Tfp pilus assembly protein PilF
VRTSPLLLACGLLAAWVGFSGQAGQADQALPARAEQQPPAPPEVAPAAPAAPVSPAPAPPVSPILRVLPTGGLRAETAALLLSGQEGGLPLAVLAVPVPGGGSGQTRVPVVVEVDGPALLAGHEEGPLRVEVCLYALSAGGGVEAALLDTVEVGPDGLARLERSGLKFHGELLLPPGETSLRVLVRNPATRSVGLKRISLAVPSFREGTPAVLPPLFAEPGEAWLVARAAEGANALPGAPGLPAARPVLAADGEARFQALTYRLRPGQEPGLTLELRKRGAERRTEMPVRLAERAAGAGSIDAVGVAGGIGTAFEVLSGSVALRGIEPGEYEVRLVLPGPVGPVFSPALPVLVAPGSAGRTWAALGSPGAAASEAESANVANPARGKGSPKRHRFAAGPLKAAYKEALRPLATGDEAGARAAVSAFETTHLVTGPETLAPEDLVEVQARVVGELSRRDPESVVALLLLYERLYHESLGRRAYLLANHDGELVFGLAEVYVRQSRSPAAKELAAGFLVDLAREQTGISMTTFTRRALSRALAYDPGNEGALLTFAVETGRRGDARGAADFLERLLRHHPKSVEGHLRLGLARMRLGDASRARQQLGEVIAADPPAEDRWMLSLAYQELARLQLGGGDAKAAARTVEEGLKRLPGDEELLLEQAALLDRAGEHGRAREVLGGIEARADGDSTPRHRYNQPADMALDRAWRALQARAAAHLPAFAAAARPGGSSP